MRNADLGPRVDACRHGVSFQYPCHDCTRLYLWETIDHRWLLRRDDDAKVPAGAPNAFATREDAEGWAKTQGWHVIPPIKPWSVHEIS